MRKNALSIQMARELADVALDPAESELTHEHQHSDWALAPRSAIVFARYARHSAVPIARVFAAAANAPTKRSVTAGHA